MPSWLSPVERLAVNQSVKGPNPFDGATSQLQDIPVFFFYLLLTILKTPKFSVVWTAFFGVVDARNQTRTVKVQLM